MKTAFKLSVFRFSLLCLHMCAQVFVCLSVRGTKTFNHSHLHNNKSVYENNEI